MIRNCSTCKANTMLLVASFDDLTLLVCIAYSGAPSIEPICRKPINISKLCSIQKVFFFKKKQHNYRKKNRDYLKLYFLDFVIIIYMILYYSKHFLQRFRLSSLRLYKIITFVAILNKWRDGTTQFFHVKVAQTLNSGISTLFGVH